MYTTLNIEYAFQIWTNYGCIFTSYDTHSFLELSLIHQKRNQRKDDSFQQCVKAITIIWRPKCFEMLDSLLHGMLTSPSSTKFSPVTIPTIWPFIWIDKNLPTVQLYFTWKHFNWKYIPCFYINLICIAIFLNQFLFWTYGYIIHAYSMVPG